MFSPPASSQILRATASTSEDEPFESTNRLALHHIGSVYLTDWNNLKLNKYIYKNGKLVQKKLLLQCEKVTDLQDMIFIVRCLLVSGSVIQFLFIVN